MNQERLLHEAGNLLSPIHAPEFPADTDERLENRLPGNGS